VGRSNTGIKWWSGQGGPAGESQLSTIHDSVIASFSTLARSTCMGVPEGTAVSDLSAYLRCGVAFRGGPSSVVASPLRCAEERFVASASPSVRCVLSVCVSKRVVASRKRAVAFAFDRVPKRIVASAYGQVGMRSFCQVGLRSVASAFQLSPKLTLAPVLLSLRRAAQANKSLRIAGRLGRFAKGKARQQLH
jgi:hypothetical protein